MSHLRRIRTSTLWSNLPLRTHVVAALLLALTVVALRMPGLGDPLGIDEGGMSLIGSDWLRMAAHGHAGDSLYGNQWIDRPPLILALYGSANLLGGALGVRLLGLVAALVVAILAGSIAERIGGARAWLPASLITGVLLSTPAIDGDRTPGELLAAVPAAITVTLLTGVALADRRRQLDGARVPLGHRRRLLLLVGAGAAAACAPLIKQSALDGCLVALAWFAWRAVADRAAGGGWRGLARDVGCFAGGAIAAAGITVALAIRAGTSFSDLVYALVGFRVDVLVALSAQSVGPAGRVSRLLAPALGSGLLLVALLVPLGLWVAARRGPLAGAGAAMLGGWLLSAAIGVAGGGYYWAHYLIQLAPPVSIAAGIFLARQRRFLPVAVIAALLLIATIGQLVRSQVMLPARMERAGYHLNAQQPVVVIGDFVRRNSLPSDRVAVIYARANVPYYAQREPATSFMWSSMYRALPDARASMLASLSGPGRAPWIVLWQPTTSYGMDADGSMRRALDRGYRTVAVICGKPIMLRTDRALPAVVLPTQHCAQQGPPAVFGSVPVSQGFTHG